MDCKVVLDSKKILVDRDELNFGANIFPMSLFEEDVSSYRFRKIDLKYLSDDIELLISKSSNTVYVRSPAKVIVASLSGLREPVNNFV